MKISISVIMPARNVARYIHEAVESVLAQKGVRFELLIADDASTDATWKKLQVYRSDSRVKLWRFRQRHGAAGARNFLLRFARGRFVAPCDADDKILPGYLKVLYQAIKDRPEAGVVFLKNFLQKKGDLIQKSPNILGPDEMWDLLSHGSVGHPGTLIRRSMIKKAGGYDEDFPFLHDYDLFLKLAEVTRFLCLKSKPLFFYRKRAGTISDQSMKDYRRIFRAIMRKAILRRYHTQVSW